MLLKTYFILDLLTDNDRYQFFKRGIRGGQSVIFKKCAKANNKHLRDWSSNEISTYLDANNLFGVSMSCKLPQGMFEWVKGEDISIDNIMNYIEVTDNEAFISEVD